MAGYTVPQPGPGLASAQSRLFPSRRGLVAGGGLSSAEPTPSVLQLVPLARHPLALAGGSHKVQMASEVAGRCLALHPPYQRVQALEAGMSLEADVVPRAGAVVVFLEEVLDAPEVLVDAEVKVAGPSPVEARGVGWEAALEVVDVVVELVEEVVACSVEPVHRDAWTAEDVEEVLEEVEGGVCGLLCVVGVQKDVREGKKCALMQARLCRAGSHLAEELEAVPDEGVVVEAQGAAGEGVGGRREEEQEGQEGTVDGWWWWG